MEVMQIVLMRKYILLKNREIKISNSTKPFHNVSWFIIANCCWQFVRCCKFQHKQLKLYKTQNWHSFFYTIVTLCLFSINTIDMQE